MRNSDKENEKESVRFTCYVSHTTLDALERAWYELRQRAGSGGRPRISRSLIIEIALQIALEELNAKGARSRLASRVVDRTQTDSGGAAPKVAPRPTRRA
jgi:hypothetical protein